LRVKGKLVTFEGIDGSGKTTVSTTVFSILSSKNLPVYYTFEPTYTRFGSLVHRFLRGEIEASPHLQALAFAVDRAYHIQTEILPALRSNKIVIVDRYVHSSYAYQGVLTKDLKWVIEINKFAIKPNLAIFIDVPPSIALKRLRRKKSIYERENFLKRVRRIYKIFVKKGELVEIDGTKKKEQVVKDALKVIRDNLNLEFSLE